MTNPHDIVIRPIVTEQSMADMADRKYTFVVQKGANKTEIKTASYKKAVVKLTADSKEIEFFQGM